MSEPAPLPLDVFERRTDPRLKESYTSLNDCYTVIRMLVSRVRYLEQRTQAEDELIATRAYAAKLEAEYWQRRLEQLRKEITETAKDS